MANWDVFHSDRLEVERGLSTAEVRAALARGDLRDDDLVRPAGSTNPWSRLAELPDLLESAPAAPAPPPPPPVTAPVPPAPSRPEPRIEHEQEFDIISDLSEAQEVPAGSVEDVPVPVFAEDDEDEEEAGDEEEPIVLGDDGEAPAPGPDDSVELELDLERDTGSRVALPVVSSRDWDRPQYDPDQEFDEDADETAAEFTLSRSGPEKVEELDLAAMVDVAFQLVLFFLVTATTVLYKSLEVPKPNPESPASSATQGKSRSLDDLKADYILVDIDSSGAMKIDREPVAADMSALVERLRAAREATGRKAMLLTADYVTQHRNAVLAYDAANEIGLGIAIARPAPPPAAAPVRAARPAPKARESSPPSGGQ